MKKHTPGPWAILDRAEDSRTHISNGAHIVCTLGTTRTDGSPNHSPNALLIAAAPDLLEACESFLQMLKTGSNCDKRNPYTIPEVKAAISAILKAKGEA